MNLTNVQLGSNAAPGAPFTMNRYIDAGAFKLVLNGTGTNIFELTTGAAGATRRFAFAASGQYTMDAYGVGAFTGTAAKWLAVTAAGLVIEEAPPAAATITADNGLTMSTATNVQWRGTLNQATTINTAGFNIVFTGSNATQSLLTVTNTNSSSGAYAISATAAANVAAISASNSSTGGGIQGTGTSGTGVIGVSTTGLGGGFSVNPASTNTVAIVIELTSKTSGTAAAGLGGRIQYTLENSTLGTNFAVGLDAVWVDPVSATRTTKFIINTVLAAVTVMSLTLYGDGSVQLRSITATAASAITAADAMIVYVSDTDATFTAAGFWGREAGAWIKL